MVTHYLFLSLFPSLRAYSPDVAGDNTDHKGRSYRIAPISVELRPTAAMTELGFVLPEAQVDSPPHSKTCTYVCDTSLPREI